MLLSLSVATSEFSDLAGCNNLNTLFICQTATPKRMITKITKYAVIVFYSTNLINNENFYSPLKKDFL